MSTPHDIIAAAEAEVCRPWLRHILSHTDWLSLVQASIDAAWTLLAHWADTRQAHALFLDPEVLAIVPVSTEIVAGRYPALSPAMPGAAWYERMIHDLWGHEAEGGRDLRPWLDHGNWPQVGPMALRPPVPRPEPPAMTEPVMPEAPMAEALMPAADSTMVLPLGPIWGRLEEAAHLRLALDGPVVRRAESLLGFTHKGTLMLMRGKSPRAAARFAARLSGDATVAHSVAFAQATESAMDVLIPARATALRIVMMELERIAVHLDNLAEVGRLAGSGTVHTSCGLLRETLLRACDAAFGHRLMMDCVVPGGIVADIADDGPRGILRALGEVASQLDMLRRLHDGPALSARLAGLGRAGTTCVASLGVGGVVGRAAGRAFDVRTVFSPAYGQFAPRLAIREQGDAAARQHLRLVEIAESLRLAGAALDALPDGPVGTVLPQVSGEGIACTESARGDVWHWLRLDHGQIAAVFARDPGWALWPLAERMLASAYADDADLIRASMALPASGMDL